MVDMSIKTTVTGGGDYRWLRSRHGKDNAHWPQDITP